MLAASRHPGLLPAAKGLPEVAFPSAVRGALSMGVDAASSHVPFWAAAKGRWEGSMAVTVFAACSQLPVEKLIRWPES